MTSLFKFYHEKRPRSIFDTNFQLKRSFGLIERIMLNKKEVGKFAAGPLVAQRKIKNVPVKRCNYSNAKHPGAIRIDPRSMRMKFVVRNQRPNRSHAYRAIITNVNTKHRTSGGHIRHGAVAPSRVALMASRPDVLIALMFQLEKLSMAKNAPILIRYWALDPVPNRSNVPLDGSHLNGLNVSRPKVTPH